MVNVKDIGKPTVKLFIRRYRPLLTAAFFFVIGALLYLPFATHAGYYDDDWFAMYAAKVAGPEIFREFYVMDSRPGRALVVIPLYLLFRGIPFYYAISAYLFRAAGALALLWLLRLLWPENKKETFLAALFFLAYPGFLSVPTPIDFQTHLVGIWMAFLSLGLSVKSLFVTNRLQRILLWVGAVGSGWFYLMQMEYYIGFEMVRILLFLLIFLRRKEEWKQTTVTAIKSWIPYALIPLVFLVWRLLLFEGTRKVTDVDLQLGIFTAAPIHTSLTWLLWLIQDTVSVTLLAWSAPLAQLAFDMDLVNSLTALGLALVVLGLFFFFFPTLTKSGEENKVRDTSFGTEALWLGLAWVTCGLIPVVLGNRHVVFPEFSRYGLVSAGGGVIFVTALLGRLPGRTFQRTVIALLLVSATVTHYANAARFAAQMDDIRSFWWQVSWRVPQFERGTTIVARYPIAGIREPSFVWGPANQIYFPYRLNPEGVTTGIAAIRLDRDSVRRILNRERQFMDRYYLVAAFPNPRHITVITQPTPQSCVQVIDGTAPEYSSFEDPMFLLVGPSSETENIMAQAQPADVPESLFGPEPSHKWCYYYEKAALARQQGDWDEVLRLADEAAGQDLKPHDRIEWLPFLQAFALHGRAEALENIMKDLLTDETAARQACEKLNNLQVDENLQNLLNSQYCVFP